MGSELSSEEELYNDLLNSSVMCKADINENTPPQLNENAPTQLKKNIALLKNEIERIRKPTTFYD